MKAMVLKAANTPFVLETVPDPVPGPGEAVAQVLACGSGLTIQHYKAGRTSATFPRIIGHEITGEIVELGANVSGLEEGDAVTAYYYLYCGYCRWCLANLEPLCENLAGNVGRDCDGGYAEYIKLRADMFLKLPEGLAPPPAPGRDWRRHRRHRDPIQGRAPGAHPAWRDGRRVRRRRRAWHPHGDVGALGARPSDRRRPRLRQVRNLP